MQFLENLSNFEQVLLLIAVPSTLFYLIMVITTFLGMDSTDGVEADFDGDLDDSNGSTIQLFTIRNLLSLLIGIGWGGMAILDLGGSKTSSIVGGILIGIGFALLQMILFYLMYRLHSPNTPTKSDAIGATGTVYLTIPGGNKMGKVIVQIKGSSREINAISKDGTAISNGTSVTVVDIRGSYAVVQAIN